MFILGHLGIGSKMATPFMRGLPKRWLFVGTLLPDLIDKPLYYGLVFFTGRRGTELGLISGTRTFGHTAIFLILLALIAVFRRSKLFAALAIGVATHLFLDNLADHFGPNLYSGTVHALLFPFLGYQFPVMPFQNAREHLNTLGRPFVFGAEILGGLILAWDFWKDQHYVEILKMMHAKRVHIRIRDED